MSCRRGAFIVIEGLDRSGKTTQISLLHERLTSECARAVKLIKFPDRTTPIGKMIDDYLRSQSELDDHAVHLLFSANRWELASTIESLLNEGTTVLCDRYAFSGMAFTFAKSRASTAAQERFPYEWCRAPDAGLPAPDLTLFLDISPGTAKQRGGYGEERYEKEELQRRVREVFKRIKEDVQASGGRWINMDAGQDKHAVQDKVWNHVKDLADGVSDRSLKTLWTSSNLRADE